MSNDIYSYIKENFGIEVTDYQFKRDYIKEPLKKIPRNNFGGLIYEKPFKEDLEYLYNGINITKFDLSKLLKTGQTSLAHWLKEYNIKKNISNRIENTKKSNLKKYGVENVFQLEEIKEKSKETSLEKYGTISYAYTEEAKNRISIKNKEKSKQAKEVRKQTNLEKYGVEHYNNSKKAKQTNLEKYGYEAVSQIHYDKEIFELINDKERLVKYINDNKIVNIVDLAMHLKCVSTSTLGKIVKKYQIEDMFDYCKSIYEKEIKKYINQYYETENNTRKYLNNKEIDIFIPELKIGIEFNGNFWHCEYGKERNYHQDKSKLAESKGIFLYHIFEYEWLEKKDKIINQLNNLLRINQEKIFARKSKKIFLEENHLQGNDSSLIKLGLYYQNELVSLMTFCKPRFNKKYEWELSRFCSKNNCNVIGGASKLWKYFIKKYKPQSIISYSNTAHTRGKLYETLGFNLDSISEPNYVWWKNDFKSLSRYQCQKYKLLQEGFEGNSEAEIMHNRGYYRIYDCGNKVWIWNNMNK